MQSLILKTKKAMGTLMDQLSMALDLFFQKPTNWRQIKTDLFHLVGLLLSELLAGLLEVAMVQWLLQGDLVSIIFSRLNL